jgi:uncharacterized protein (DUF58 family)
MEGAEELLDPGTLVRLERLVALARRTPAARRRLLKRPGRGIEPGGRRPYSPGDDVRLLDWPAYARLEQLLVKVQEELPPASIELLIDGSGSMAQGSPNPAVRASLAAASLAACAAARQVRVAVWWGGPTPERHLLSRPGQLVGLLRFLARQRPAGAGGLQLAARRAAEARGARGAAVLLSDGLDPSVPDAAAHLRSRGYDALVVLTGSAAEVEPALQGAFEDAPLTLFEDAETGEQRLLPGSPRLLEQAAAARAKRQARLLADLDQRGVAAETLAAGAPFEAVALGLLGRDRPGIEA